jgi:hypothetical protein
MAVNYQTPIGGRPEEGGSIKSVCMRMGGGGVNTNVRTRVGGGGYILNRPNMSNCVFLLTSYNND